MSCCHAQEYYLKVIEEILDLIREFKLPESYAECFSAMRADIRERELLVPVIGHFSAGKSAMLNSLMNSAVLPVGISPETTLATELRYSSAESITVWDTADGAPRNFAMTEFGNIISRPEKWLYVSLGLSCNVLRDIEPLVLVDMPGFNSPVAQHSKAISLYLDRGAFYIVMIPADAGTIDRSILLQLNLINSLRRNFAVFVSKSDLKTPDEIEIIKKHISSIIREEFDMDCPVTSISEKNVSAIMEALKYADPDNLFKSIYQEMIDEKINSLIGNVRTELNSLKRDSSNLGRAMNELHASLKTFESKTEDEIRRMRSNYSSNMVNDIVNRTGTALSLSAEEIAAMVISGDEQGAQQLINSIVQSEVLMQLERKFGDLSISITADMAASLKSLDATLKEFSIDRDFIQNICDSIQKILSFWDAGAKDSGKGGINPATLVALGSTVSAAATTATAMAAGTTGTILGFSLGAAVPVIGAVVAALPLILTPIYEKHKRAQLREEVVNKLRAVVFPGIKHKLRSELSVQISTQIENMINRVRNEFQSALKRKEESVAAAVNLKQQEKENADRRMADLEKVAAALLRILSQTGERKHYE